MSFDRSGGSKESALTVRPGYPSIVAVSISVHRPSHSVSVRSEPSANGLRPSLVVPTLATSFVREIMGTRRPPLFCSGSIHGILVSTLLWVVHGDELALLPIDRSNCHASHRTELLEHWACNLGQATTAHQDLISILPGGRPFTYAHAHHRTRVPKPQTRTHRPFIKHHRQPQAPSNPPS